MDAGSPKARHGPCPTGSHTFMTPVQSHSVSGVDKEYNAEIEVHGDDATQEMLSSEVSAQ